MTFSMLNCRVEGCTGKTFDESEICPACRTKIERREVVVVAQPDPAERLATIKNVALLVVLAILSVVVVGPSDFLGGVR